MTLRLAPALVVLVAVSGFSGAACSSTPTATRPGGTDEDPEPTKPVSNDPTVRPTGPGAEDYVWPYAVFGGYVEGKTFKVPVSTNLSGSDVEWSVGDTSIASIAATTWVPAELASDPDFQKYPEQFAIVTSKKPGTTTVTATKGTTKVTVPITISAYTDADFTAGEARYKTGEPTEPTRIPCSSCHETPAGVDHSPTWTGALPDAEVLRGIQDSRYDKNYVLKKGTHTWSLTDAETNGILAYLRGLNPKGLTE